MSVPTKNGQKNATAKAKAPGVKATVTKPKTDKKAEAKTLSLEERIQKADELKSLTLKRERTIKTLHHIRTFSFASDESCVLTISDSENQKFETSNSNLVNLLKDYLIKVLSDKVSELDDEIMAFNL